MRTKHWVENIKGQGTIGNREWRVRIERGEVALVKDETKSCDGGIKSLVVYFIQNEHQR